PIADAVLAVNVIERPRQRRRGRVMAGDEQGAKLLLQLDVVVGVAVRLGQKLAEDGAFRRCGAAPSRCDLLGQHAVELCSQPQQAGPWSPSSEVLPEAR